MILGLFEWYIIEKCSFVNCGLDEVEVWLRLDYGSFCDV